MEAVGVRLTGDPVIVPECEIGKGGRGNMKLALLGCLAVAVVTIAAPNDALDGDVGTALQPGFQFAASSTLTRSEPGQELPDATRGLRAKSDRSAMASFTEWFKDVGSKVSTLVKMMSSPQQMDLYQTKAMVESRQHGICTFFQSLELDIQSQRFLVATLRAEVQPARPDGSRAASKLGEVLTSYEESLTVLSRSAKTICSPSRALERLASEVQDAKKASGPQCSFSAHIHAARASHCAF